MRLGYSDDCNLLTVTTTSHCRFDSVSDFAKPVREFWKRHNVASYRRLQSESREALGGTAAPARSREGQENKRKKYS